MNPKPGFDAKRGGIDIPDIGRKGRSGGWVKRNARP
jgi:hypothetical protein